MNHPYLSAGFAVLLSCSIRLGLALSLLGFGILRAAEPADATISLRDAVEATLEANPQLSIYQFRAAGIQGNRTTAALRPALQANAGVEEVFGSGVLNGINGAEITLSLSRVIELGSQREARIGAVESRLDVLDAQQRVLELDLLAEVTRRFIAVASAQQTITFQQRATELARETLEALQPLVTAGQTPGSELARARAALDRAQLDENRARTALEVAKVNLAAMWGNQAPAFNGVQADLLDTGDPGVLTDILLGLQDNPDILVFASESRLRDAELQEAVSAQRGTVQWTAGARHLREVGDTGFVFGISMPLGSRARAAGAIATARANLDEVGGERAVALNRMQAQVNTLHLQLRQATQDVQVLRDEVLPELNAALEQTRNAYLNGLYSYLELISAQAEYLNAERAVIEAATDAHLLRTEIERLSGAPLNPDQQETRP